MRLYKSLLIISAVTGGLWLGSSILGSTAYASTDTGNLATDQSSSQTDNNPISNSKVTTANIPPSTIPVNNTIATLPTTDATINNSTQSNALSSDASVTSNTTAGDATSGTANDTSNTLNSVNSATSLSGGGIKTFTQDINGSHNGDLNIDPGTVAQSLQSQNAVASTTNSSGTINNNIDLGALSGNASVLSNTTAGNATSGDAVTEANLINLINSGITDNNAFLGVINIYGDLNGNIVLPSNLIDSLSNNQSSSSSNPTSLTTATVNNNQEVNNNVNLLAKSGDARVNNNTTAGNATSGNASTAVNIYNLLNSQIVGGNLLLVFVNVSGTWFGLLLNAPAGSTSTAIGSNIQQSSIIPNSQTNINNKALINNNINLNSVSGNALVSKNTTAGNATSGNASAIVNIANILGDQINLTGWLGILIINVFGSWNGSLILQPIANTAVVLNQPINTYTSTSITTISYETVVTYFNHTYHSFYANTNYPDTNQSTTPPSNNDSQAKNYHGLSNFASIISPTSHINKNNDIGTKVAVFGIVFAGILIACERIFALIIRP